MLKHIENFVQNYPYVSQTIWYVPTTIKSAPDLKGWFIKILELAMK